MNDQQMSKFFSSLAIACDAAAESMNSGIDPQSITDVEGAIIDMLCGLQKGFAEVSEDLGNDESALNQVLSAPS